VWTQSDPPGDEYGDADGGGVVDGELVVAGGDAAPVLEAAEGALDQVAQSVGERVERMAALAGRVVGDDRQRAAGDQELPEGVVPMAGAQREGERPALAVDDGVDLGRPATA
jgi:hypothetical protein